MNLEWHHFLPIPLTPAKEYVLSDHTEEDFMQFLLASGASMVGRQFLIAPYSSPSAGLTLMRLSVYGPPIYVAAVSGYLEMKQVETIAASENTPSWWKALVLSGN